ncbi:hypothetical protein CDL15_Pgr012318 [Punica granatum]|uniref:Uncharacterized protein n=1 Tax=Punica granatum TaxID=22663 RepID=A0A218VW95_PUNGR|nr:hypothetical protein CDL15_Pgr012318 [Punica granatum]
MWGRNPKTVNAGPRPESNKCKFDKKVQEMQKLRPMLGNSARRCKEVDRPSGHNSSCYGGRVKTAGGLPAVVGTTRLSCGWVAGMDSASSHGASCYGEVKTVGGLLSKVGTTSLSCGAW